MENTKNISEEALPTLNEMLNQLNAKRIEKFEDFSPLFNVGNLIDGQPEIVTKRPTIIIFDNEIFNNTYVVDLFLLPAAKYAEEIKNVDFYYCDDIKVRTMLFRPEMRFTDDDLVDELLRRKIERDLIVPSVMFIIPEKEIIGIQVESMFLTINSDAIFSIVEIAIGKRPISIAVDREKSHMTQLD